MRILWLHNFNPEVKSSGVFMHTYLSYLNTHQFIDEPICVEYIGNIKNLALLPAYISKIRLLAKEYDIVHVQYGSVASLLVAIALRNLDCSKVLSVRGSDWHYLLNGSLRNKFHSYVSCVATRIAVPFYDLVLFQSHRMLCSVNNSSVVASLHTDPININSFTIRDKQAEKDKLGLDKHKKYILFASILKDNPVKKYWLAEKVINEVKKIDSDVELMQVSGKDHSTMNSLYNAASLVLLTSSHEGWPNVIKESLSCGVPFVASDVSDLALVTDKTHGLCKVASDSVDDIKNAVLQVINQPVTLKDRELLRDCISNISIDKASQELYQLYKQQIKQQIK